MEMPLHQLSVETSISRHNPGHQQEPVPASQRQLDWVGVSAALRQSLCWLIISALIFATQSQAAHSQVTVAQFGPGGAGGFGETPRPEFPRPNIPKPPTRPNIPTPTMPSFPDLSPPEMPVPDTTFPEPTFPESSMPERYKPPEITMPELPVFKRPEMPEIRHPSVGFEYTCSQCNKTVEQHDNVCPHCGVLFTSTQYGSTNQFGPGSSGITPNRSSSTSRESTGFAVGVIIMVLLVGAIVFFAVIGLVVFLIVKAVSKPRANPYGNQPGNWQRPGQPPVTGYGQQLPRQPPAGRPPQFKR